MDKRYSSIYSINLDIIEKLGGDKTKKFDSVYSEARYIAEDLMGAPIQKWDSIYQILLWILDNYEPIPPEPECERVIDFIIDVVANISDYQGSKPMVYSRADKKWYMLTDTGSYEEYGIMGEGLDTPKYVGKLTVADGHEYEWSGTEWVDLGEASLYGAGVFDGASWFDTGIKGKNNIKVAAGFSINDTTKTTGIVGSRYTYSSTVQNGCCMFGATTSKMDYQLGNKVITNVDIKNNEYYEGEFYLYSADGTNTNVNAVCKLYKDGVQIENDSYTVSGANRTADGNGYNMFVGAINQMPGKFGLEKSTISYVKIYENIDADGNGELTHDFRFQDVDGVGKMIDIITGNFYDNKGTGNITVEGSSDIPKEYDTLDAPILLFEADTYCDLYKIQDGLAYDGLNGYSTEEGVYYTLNGNSKWIEKEHIDIPYDGIIFTANEDGAIAMNHAGGNIPEIQYTFDGVNWTDWDGSEIDVDAGTQVAFKGTKVSVSGTKYSRFSTTGNFTVKGIIVSLLDNGECTLNEIPASAFVLLFSNNAGIYDVSEIIMPDKVGSDSLEALFRDMPNITKAPALPAAAIPNYAYWQMFMRSANVNYIECLATSISSTSSSLSQWVSGVASEGTFVQNTEATFWTIGASGIPTGWNVLYKGNLVCNFSNHSLRTPYGVNYTFDVIVDKDRHCHIEAPDWVHLNIYDFDGNKQTIEASVDFNYGDARSGEITVSDSVDIKTYSISQPAWIEPNFDDTLYLEVLEDGAMAQNDFGTNIDNTKPMVFYKINDEDYGILNGEVNYSAGDIVKLRTYDGLADGKGYSGTNYSAIALTGKVNLKGKLFGLLKPNTTPTEMTMPLTHAFDNNDAIVSTADLDVSGEKICTGAFHCTFRNNTSLTSVFEIPNYTLTKVGGAQYQDYYSNMYQGCASLVNAPTVLPSKTAYAHMYRYMFDGCVNLETVPRIDATSWQSFGAWDYHYFQYMFRNCKKITKGIIPKYYNFTGTAQQYAIHAQIAQEMYKGCENISWIAWLTKNMYWGNMENWVDGVAPTGVFVKNIEATWANEFGVSRIPEGWTVIYYDTTEERYYTDTDKAVECDEYGNPILPM